HTGASSLLADGSAAAGASGDSSVLIHSAGEFLQGVLLVAVQDETGSADPAEEMRIADAITSLNQTLGAYGVNLEEVAGGDSAAAASVMYNTLSTGAARRGLTANDLSLLGQPGGDGSAHGLHVGLLSQGHLPACTCPQCNGAFRAGTQAAAPAALTPARPSNL